MGCNVTKTFTLLLIWSFIGSSFWKGIGWISTDFFFGPFSIIESSGEDNSTSRGFLSVLISYFIILTLTFFREEPTESKWTPYNLPVSISKISECKQVELSAGYLSVFAYFKSFCGTWVVLYPFSDFSLPSIKLCYNVFSFFS